MESPLLFCEEYEWQGYWWIPEDPANLVPGVLKYDGKGKIFLELIGSFSGFNYSNGNLCIRDWKIGVLFMGLLAIVKLLYLEFLSLSPM